VARPLSFPRRIHRWLAYLVAVGAAVTVVLGVADPARANDGPTAVAIAGPGLSAPIALHEDGEPELFKRLLHQVSWMAGRGGDPMQPDPATLGPKYVLTVLSNDKPVQTYEVYPRAQGGPKAFRPAAQPQGKVTEAWFYVSMSVPELLHAAGVPLTDRMGVGLEYQDPAGYIPAATSTDIRPLSSLTQAVRTQRQTLVIWAGSALLVLALVVLAARHSRRRYAA
jgi:hypothetical protein